MRLVFISDTHSLHAHLTIPEGDVLIHCGDFTGNNTLTHVENFNTFLGSLDHTHKIVIAGNHDGLLETDNDETSCLFTNATYLQDSEVVINGIKFYGSPWTPVFFNWYFMATAKELEHKWQQIPNDVDILITHGPPKGILDSTTEGFNVGCDALLKRVGEIKPEIHAFGHIHEGYGVKIISGTTYVNASSLNERYQVTNAPIVLDIEPRNVL